MLQFTNLGDIPSDQGCPTNLKPVGSICVPTDFEVGLAASGETCPTGLTWKAYPGSNIFPYGYCTNPATDRSTSLFIGIGLFSAAIVLLTALSLSEDKRREAKEA